MSQIISNKNSFSPECLTISLGSDCNLNCLYCFSKNSKTKKNNILNETDFLKCISKAAELVAVNCMRKNLPFYLGFQSSGEPLMYFTKLKLIFEIVSAIIQKNNLRLFSFITSNGCMEKEKYQWVATHIDRICLSIDGNEEINDIQRRTKDKKGTYRRILDTIDILKQNNKTPAIRTTVTRHNVNQLVRIVRHFIEMKLLQIQVEPVYLLQSNGDLTPSPDLFVENYLKAKIIASNFGGMLNYSGYRKNERHGTYCNINKNVLLIGLNGNASICLFKDSENTESPFIIGHYDTCNEQFIIEDKKIDKLKKLIKRRYHDCEKCEIKDSCVKGCPDFCVMEKDANYTINESLRCKINRLLYQKEMEHEKYS
jgi:radical SAM protein with 4Fe4S-binding SPASM domain